MWPRDMATYFNVTSQCNSPMEMKHILAYSQHKLSETAVRAIDIIRNTYIVYNLNTSGMIDPPRRSHAGGGRCLSEDANAGGRVMRHATNISSPIAKVPNRINKNEAGKMFQFTMYIACQ